MRLSRNKAAILIILAAVLCVYLGRFLTGFPSKFVKPNGMSTRSKGNPAAPVSIIEYIDFQCPACAKGVLVLKDYFERYPSKIYLEMRHFPFSRMHRFAFEASEFAECAAQQGNFWEYAQELAIDQPRWSKMMDATGVFRRVAENLLLDMPKLDACLEDEKARSAILKDKEEGKSLGIDSTPTYIINGKMVVGVQPLQEELQKLIGK